MQTFLRLIAFFFFIFISHVAFAANAQKFISVADIHFDPFLECEKTPTHCEILKKLRTAPHQKWEAIFEKYAGRHPSLTGQDTNYYLFKSSLKALKKSAQTENPQFVLVLGDFLAHDYREKYIKYSGDNSLAGYQTFVRRTLEFLAEELNKIFPHIDVYPVIGNNDSYTGDYSVVPEGKFLKDTTAVWVDLMKDENNQDAFEDDFPTAGYYAVTVPHHEKDKIILLNTVLFSTHAQDHAQKEAAQEQLQWLREQIDLAHKQHQHVIIGFHIPVGINVSATLKDKFGMIWKFWQRPYRKEFDRIIGQYPDTITAVLGAHIHRDIFQFIPLETFSRIPIIITPSISPLFGNNPGFKVMTYENPGFYVTKVEAYIFDLANANAQDWKVGYDAKLPHQTAVKIEVT